MLFWPNLNSRSIFPSSSFFENHLWQLNSVSLPSISMSTFSRYQPGLGPEIGFREFFHENLNFSNRFGQIRHFEVIRGQFWPFEAIFLAYKTRPLLLCPILIFSISPTVGNFSWNVSVRFLSKLFSIRLSRNFCPVSPKSPKMVT